MPALLPALRRALGGEEVVQHLVLGAGLRRPLRLRRLALELGQAVAQLLDRRRGHVGPRAGVPAIHLVGRAGRRTDLLLHAGAPTRAPPRARRRRGRAAPGPRRRPAASTPAPPAGP